MLEYLLLRPSDAGLFQGLLAGSWSHIVVDEAHVYSGTLGTEIAYLLRRLKARLEIDEGSLRCFATSATIGSTKSDHEQVARFASDLFGEPFADGTGDDPIDVVTSSPDRPEADFGDVWGTLSDDRWLALSELLSPDEPRWAEIVPTLDDLVSHDAKLALADRNQWRQALGHLMLGEATTQSLLSALSEGPVDASDADTVAAIRDGLTPPVLSAVVQVLAKCQRPSGAQLLSARYHSILRAPDGAFVTLLEPLELTLKRKVRSSSDLGDVPAYEVATCRHCAQEYILGHREDPRRADGGGAIEILSQEPAREGDDAALPQRYYQLILDDDDTDQESEDEDNDGDRNTRVSDSVWLCPVCGSLHDKPESTVGHAREHPPVRMLRVVEATSIDDKRKCIRCGYSSPSAIQRVRVSPEAAGSVLVYDLIRDLPAFDVETQVSEVEQEWGVGASDADGRPKAGSLICFSDRRQDAAFFAPALERTYGSITRRQVLYRAARSIPTSPFTPSDWANAVAREISDGAHLPATASVLEVRKSAWAWVLAELMADDSRASLEGLGLVSYRIRGADALPVGPLVREPWNLTTEQAGALLERLVDTLRDGKAVQWQEGITGTDQLMPEHWFPAKFERQRNGDERRRPSLKSWLPSGPSVNNSRLDFASRLLQSEGRSRSEAREIAASLLPSVWDVHLFSAIPDGMMIREGDKVTGQIQAHPDLWEISLDPEGLSRCDKCGSLATTKPLETCSSYRCDGRMLPVDPDEDEVDRYYRALYREDDPLPLQIEEHTGQLRSEHAAKIQQQFLEGRVNVLSCTTTFELGVDVGDLRSVFMRNVPPSPANYVQRAGRTGRRSGAPGFALTFARLRSHDQSYFQRPGDMISGRIPAPACYLSNSRIAARHLYAIALSEFFRDRPENERYCGNIRDFFDPSSSEASGLVALRDYLAEHPSKIEQAAERVLPAELAQDLGIPQWAWVEALVGDDGRIGSAIRGVRKDWDDLDQERGLRVEARRSVDWILRSQRRILDDKVISLLAAHGALPKYGFPTDLAELSLPREVPESSWLEMQRGLRTAIYEYAPGSEVVAVKKVWRSAALRKIPGKDWESRAYWLCGECGHFHTRIAAEGEMQVADCPVCGNSLGHSTTYVVPQFGFVARLAKKGVGERRPRAAGGVRIYFDGSGVEQDTVTHALAFATGRVDATYARNGRLHVVNAGHLRRGYKICPSCGGAGPTTGGNDVHMRRDCTGVLRGGQHLGTYFETDVLHLALDPNDLSFSQFATSDDVNSALWACVLSAAEMLVVPESELGGTSFRMPGGKIGLVIYDDVPGGAGRVQMLHDRVPELLHLALQRVSGDCGCGEETSCYGCLRAYSNQFAHDQMSRAGALGVLRSVLGD